MMELRIFVSFPHLHLRNSSPKCLKLGQYKRKRSSDFTSARLHVWEVERSVEALSHFPLIKANLQLLV